MIRDVLFDTKIILENIMKSGLVSVNEVTVSRLNEISAISEQYGLAFACEKASFIADTIEKSRHGADKKINELTSAYYELFEYNRLCIKKLTRDNVKENMKKQ